MSNTVIWPAKESKYFFIYNQNRWCLAGFAAALLFFCSFTFLNPTEVDLSPFLQEGPLKLTEDRLKQEGYFESKNASSIPYNLIFIYKYDLVKEVARSPKDQLLKDNVIGIIDSNIRSNQMKPNVLFYDDDGCIKLIQELGDDVLASLFMLEDKGMLKGDMCRIVALYLHGGYYFDVDIGHRYLVRDLLPDNVGFSTNWDIESEGIDTLVSPPRSITSKEKLLTN